MTASLEERLKRLRREHGWSKGLGPIVLGFTRYRYDQIEASKGKPPTAEELRRITKSLKVNLPELLETGEVIPVPVSTRHRISKLVHPGPGPGNALPVEYHELARRMCGRMLAFIKGIAPSIKGPKGTRSHLVSVICGPTENKPLHWQWFDGRGLPSLPLCYQMANRAGMTLLGFLEHAFEPGFDNAYILKELDKDFSWGTGVNRFLKKLTEPPFSLPQDCIAFGLEWRGQQECDDDELSDDEPEEGQAGDYDEPEGEGHDELASSEGNSEMASLPINQDEDGENPGHCGSDQGWESSGGTWYFLPGVQVPRKNIQSLAAALGIRVNDIVECRMEAIPQECVEALREGTVLFRFPDYLRVSRFFDFVEEYAGDISRAAGLLGLDDTEFRAYMMGAEIPAPEILRQCAEAIGIDPEMIHSDEWGEQVEAAVEKRLKPVDLVP